ncbi:carboxylesterase family protein [Herbiconiux sp. CPCC 203407]|uniref:Carboxylesterase family protein n=1 Tax=Herbiconiux oxytropis TaxID=2970915 RepID=A0AA41XCP4_9MICO|nr:carboxylesterase family protein [Herbiconiux oxytropis]MCS5722941.1 carboxylesterase family protein [Herbiconiux oxytropis]MCS5725799.1 carboxylesterase family protein [Herbiconiux oxytropis]
MTGPVSRPPRVTPPSFSPPCGPVRGRVDGEVVRVSGIRYAVARRFAAPVALPDRPAGSAPLEAVQPAPACPQGPVPFLDEVLGTRSGELAADEDCLRLSLTLPAEVGAGERLPVMVWIHGGSYVSGAGDLAIMDPKALVAEQRVIVVSVTYRLGLFGYLGLPAGAGSAGQGTAGQVPARPANLGLLDQLAALRWVQRNIAAFGGDASNVTAFGQSAGGDAVAHLMATGEAAALFRRAIIQSAPLGISRGRERMTAALAEAARSAGADDWAAMSAEEIVAREPSVAAAGRPFGLRGGMPFGTQYGHDPLPAESSIEAAWDRVAPSIDVMIGHSAEEARLFVARVPAISRLAALPVVGTGIRRLLVAVATRAVYSRAAARFARRHVRAGGSARHYVIDWAAPGNPYGSAHTIDLPLLFGDEATWRRAALVAGASWPELHAQGRRVRALWAAFARGDALPRRGRLPGALRHRAV